MGTEGKILVVDDEYLVRWSLRRFLEGEGFSTVEAASAREALDILNRDKISVLITDLIMPGMDGVELIRRARTLKPGIKVYVITADEASGLVESALEAGALKTFNKPIPFFDLLWAVQTGE